MGVLASIACGIIGSYVVVKRISFISGSIAHSAFGGIGMSFFFNIHPLIGAIGFGLVSAVIMGTVHLRYKQHEDTLIGMLWAVGMAVGILFIHFSSGYAGDLFSYLFGNILVTSTMDITLILICDVLILITVFGLYRAFQAVTFDEEYAMILNLPVTFLYFILLCLISFTTVILIRVVGVILVIALLTLPAAAALNVSRNLKWIMLLSILFGIFSTLTGIFLSHWWNIPASSIIILCCASVYFLSLGVIKFR